MVRKRKRKGKGNLDFLLESPAIVEQMSKEDPRVQRHFSQKTKDKIAEFKQQQKKQQQASVNQRRIAKQTSQQGPSKTKKERKR